MLFLEWEKKLLYYMHRKEGAKIVVSDINRDTAQTVVDEIKDN